MYATYDDWRTHWGASRSAALVAGTEAQRQSVVETYLSAFGGRINSALQAAGYTVPLVPSTVTTNVELQQQLSDLLKVNNVIGATYFYLQPNDDSPRVKAAREALEAWLTELGTGGGLPVPRPSVAGSLEWIANDKVANFTPERLARGRRAAL